MNRTLVVWILIIFTSIMALVSRYYIDRYKAERAYELAFFKTRMKWFGDSSLEYDLIYNLKDVWNEYRDIGFNGLYDPV